MNYTATFTSGTSTDTFVDNDKELANIVKEEAKKFAEVVIPEVTLGGEDFSLYMQKVSGFFAFIGTGSLYEWHHPKFLVRDEALFYGINYYIASVKALIKKFYI